MTERDLPRYLNKAQSSNDNEELELLLVGDELQRLLTMLNNMIVIFILHGLHKGVDSIQNQTPSNSNIPMVEEWLESPHQKH